MTHLTTDRSLTLGELKSLVRTFRRLRPADVEMTTIPWSADPHASGPADVLVVVGRDWNALQHHFSVTGAKNNPTVALAPTPTTSGGGKFVPVDPRTGGVLVGCPTS